jgi:hypothetical protein
MTDNRLPARWPTHAGWTETDLARATAEVAAATGFVAGVELQRRFLYDRNKTYRVRIEGTLNGTPAVLRLENLKLEEDEEAVRGAFRRQATGFRVRPPQTFTSQPFDASMGYGYSLDEAVSGSILFDPAGSPIVACEAFLPFYRELWAAVREPFWTNANGSTAVFTKSQADEWLALARKKNPEDVSRVWPLAGRLAERMQEALTGAPLRFMHAHIGGSDIRCSAGEWIVFANQFWSWRQPAYDVAFPLWNQWMALPVERRTAAEMERITEAWVEAVVHGLAGLVEDGDLYPMLLNRLYGSLLLDIPAKRGQAGETTETVAALEAAFGAEAERLLHV